MIRLRGGRLVLPDRILDGAALAIDDGRIVEIAADSGASGDDVSCAGRLDPARVHRRTHPRRGRHRRPRRRRGRGPRRGGAASPRRHRLLPDDDRLCPRGAGVLPDGRRRRRRGATGRRGARARRAPREQLPATPTTTARSRRRACGCRRSPGEPVRHDGDFTGAAIVAVIDAHRPSVRLVTLAPELDRALDLIARLVAAGHRVSLGHSAATFEQAEAAIAAGARHATHLFNRMPPLAHRAPGLAGAVLAHDEVTSEVICDGFHVHPAMARLAVRAKGVDGVLAITDATAGAGLPVGAMSVLGDQPIRVTERCAVLADGTLAGSILTMDGAFRVLVGAAGLGVVEAARICATTPATRAGTARPWPTRGRRGGRPGGARRCLACHPDLGGRVAGVEPGRPRGRLSTRGGVMASGTGRLVGLLGAGALAVTLTACTVNVNTDGATASETHTFKVTGTSKITLDTFDGAIEVHAWDRPEVEVVVEKQAQDEARLKDITVEKSQDGDQITLRVRGPASSGSSGVVIGVQLLAQRPAARRRAQVERARSAQRRRLDHRRGGHRHRLAAHRRRLDRRLAPVGRGHGPHRRRLDPLPRDHRQGRRRDRRRQRRGRRHAHALAGQDRRRVGAHRGRARQPIRGRLDGGDPRWLGGSATAGSRRRGRRRGDHRRRDPVQLSGADGRSLRRRPTTIARGASCAARSAPAAARCACAPATARSASSASRPGPARRIRAARAACRRSGRAPRPRRRRRGARGTCCTVRSGARRRAACTRASARRAR